MTMPRIWIALFRRIGLNLSKAISPAVGARQSRRPHYGIEPLEGRLLLSADLLGISDVTINAGSTQRSTVTEIAIRFDGDATTLNPQALTLRNTTTGTQVDLSGALFSYDGAAQLAKWRFPSLSGGTLANGNYLGILDAGSVSTATGHTLDGNRDGLGGDSAVFHFHRLAGDADGDRDTDFLDLFQFRSAFQKISGQSGFDTRFDFDADADVDFADLFQFRSSFSQQLAPGPALTAQLARDTARGGTDNADGITTDPGIAGKLVPAGGVTKLRAGFGDTALNEYADVTGTVQTDGSFRLTEADVVRINLGNALSDGSKVLHLRAENAAGGLLAARDVAFTLDRQAPRIEARTPAGIAASGEVVEVDLFFSESVAGLTAGDLTLSGTGAATATVDRVDSFGDSLWRFRLKGLQVGVVQVGLSGAVSDTAGNALGAQNWGFTYDDIPPQVVSVTPPEGAGVNTPFIYIDVTFSEAVAGVNAGDLVLSGTGATDAVVGIPFEWSTNMWRFPVSGLRPGTVTALLAPVAGDIRDLAGNSLAGKSWNFDNDYVAPVVLTVSPSAGGLVTASSVDIDVTFDEPVLGLDASDLVLSGAGVEAVVQTPHHLGGNRWRFSISNLDDGQLHVSLGSDPGDILDRMGNSFGGMTWTIEVDASPPTIVAVTPESTLSRMETNVVATFSESVIGVDRTDLVVAGAGGVGALVGDPVDLGNNTWSFPVSRLQNGLVSFTLARDAGDIIDLNGGSVGAKSWSVQNTMSVVDADRLVIDGLGLRMDGSGNQQRSGYNVRGAGDVNGDGRADLLVASEIWSSVVHAYVVFGTDDPGTIELSTLVVQGKGIRIEGGATGTGGFSSISGAGDVNRDGFDDVVLGLSGANVGSHSQAGEAYIVFGGSIARSISLSGLVTRGEGIVVQGQFGGGDGRGLGDLAGDEVAGVGDVNADGFADVAVGASGADPSGRTDAGTIYIVFGSASAQTLSISNLVAQGKGIAVAGAGANGRLGGRPLSGAGDFNGDGLSDLIFAGPEPDFATGSPGQAYIVFGSRTAQTLELSALVSAGKGSILSGATANDNAGRRVAAAGDFNGDGFSDVILGAPLKALGSISAAGAAYIVFGSAAGSQTIALGTLAAQGRGIQVDGFLSGTTAGFTVAGLGDTNGDGLSDVAITEDTGDIYVLHGSRASASTLRLDNIVSLGLGRRIAVRDAGDWNTGLGVAGAGDVNGDGVSDIIIGSEFSSPNGVTFAGSTYVAWGIPDRSISEAIYRSHAPAADAPRHSVGSTADGSYSNAPSDSRVWIDFAGAGPGVASAEVTSIREDARARQGNGRSTVSAVSADGRYVVFESYAANLVRGPSGTDTNGAPNVFIHDGESGVTRRLSVGTSGQQANGGSYAPAISDDGRYVTFTSDASNLVAGDTNGVSDVFVADTLLGDVRRVSVAASGTQGNGHSSDASISDDGRYVAFSSLAVNLVSGDTNARSDIFVRDLAAGTTRRVSVSSSNAQANGDSRSAVVSGDGRYVAFASGATNLVTGDTNGVDDVFRVDLVGGDTIRVSVGANGVQANAASSLPSISTSGMHIAFESVATNLVSLDTNDVQDAFVHDVAGALTSRVSEAPGDQSFTGDRSGLSLSNPAISAKQIRSEFPAAPSGIYWIDPSGGSHSDAIQVVVDQTSRNGGWTLGAQHAVSTTPLLDYRPVANDGTIAPGSSFRVNLRELGLGRAGAEGWVRVETAGGQVVADQVFSDWAAAAQYAKEGGVWAGNPNYKVQLWVREYVTPPPWGSNEGNGVSGSPQISSDGRYVVFQSEAFNLAGSDVNDVADVFLRDLQSGTVSLLSVDSLGTAGSKASGAPAISASGSHVTFSSDAVSFADNDTNQLQDVFVRDRAAGTTARVSEATPITGIDRAFVAGDIHYVSTTRTGLSGTTIAFGYTDDELALVDVPENELKILYSPDGSHWSTLSTTSAPERNRVQATVGQLAYFAVGVPTAIGGPAAALVGNGSVTDPGATFNEFVVRYTDRDGEIVPGSLGSDDVVVLAADNSALPATFLAAVVSPDGGIIDATYRVPVTSQGVFRIVMNANQVFDDTSLAVTQGVLGNYVVDYVPPTLLKVNANAVTTTGHIDIDVSFSESVIGVSIGDLVLSGDATAAAVVRRVVQVQPNLWRFTVEGLQPGQGLANIATGGHGMTDVAGHVLGISRPGAAAFLVDPDRIVVPATEIAQGSGILVNGAYDTSAGYKTAGAGDVNGDGLGDFVVSAPRADLGSAVDTGAAFVVFGRDGGGFTVDLDTLVEDGRGIRIDGAGGFAGGQPDVAGAGDVNGDGLSDILIGDANATVGSSPQAGKVYVVFGSAVAKRIDLSSGSAFVQNGLGIEIDGAQSYARTGESVAAVGDFNGDGLGDVVIGASNQPRTVTSPAPEGKAFVIFGSSAARTVTLGALSAADGFELYSQVGQARLGASVSGVGDANGDGYADVLVGAPGAGGTGREDSGRAYLIFGSKSPTALDVDATSTARRGWVFEGAHAGDGMGTSVAALGDVNGDGLADMAIGAPNAVALERNDGGMAYVLFGRETSGRTDLRSLEVDRGFRIFGAAVGDSAGSSVSGAGDFNGDGMNDILVGGFRPTAHVVFGSHTGAAVDLANFVELGQGMRVVGSEYSFGSSFQSIGDTNGDGAGDLIFGTPYYNRAEVIYGRPHQGGMNPVYRVSMALPFGVAEAVGQLGDGSDDGTPSSRAWAAYPAPGATPSGLVAVDLVAGSGDQALTFDPANGLLWLDLTRTLDLSMVDVLSGAGGWIGDGFRFATGAEVKRLFESAGVQDNSGNKSASAADLAGVQRLRSLLGTTRSSFGEWFDLDDGLGTRLIEHEDTAWGRFSGEDGLARVAYVSEGEWWLWPSQGPQTPTTMAPPWARARVAADTPLQPADRSSLQGSFLVKRVYLSVELLHEASGELHQSNLTWNATTGEVWRVDVPTIESPELDLVFAFLDSQVAGLDRSRLRVLHSTDGVTWTPLETDASELSRNRLSVTTAALGFFAIGLPEATGVPTASLGVPIVISTAGATAQQFSVHYSDSQGAVVAASLGTGDITISGPNGFSAQATLVSVNPPGDAEAVAAVYQFTPPGGSWDLSDSGTYAVKLNDAQVFNTSGASALREVLGTILVDLPVVFGDTDVAAAVRHTLGKAPDAVLRVSDVASLTALRLDATRVDSLAGLEWAQALTRLEVIPGNWSASTPGIADLNPLRFLAKLEHLALQRVGFDTADLGTPAALPSLKTLDLRYNQIGSIAGQSYLRNLGSLFLYGNPVTDFTPLRGALVTSDRTPVNADAAKTIAELAAALEYSPVEMYEWVYNNVDIQIYAGLMKGAQATFETREGGAWDQAGLLMALYEEAGIETRLVTGRAQLYTFEALASWIGVQDAEGIFSLLYYAGLDPQSDGTMSHAWVEALLPNGEGGQSWVGLDPSFKAKAFQTGVADILEKVPFDESSYLAARTRELPIEYWEDQVKAYLAEHQPGKTVADVGFQGPIVRQDFTRLPASLGNGPHSVTGRYSDTDADPGNDIPANIKYRARVSLMRGSTTLLSHTFVLPEMSLDRVNISWRVAPGQEAVVASYGGLEKTPDGAIQVIPELRLGGQVIATGAQVPWRARLELGLKFAGPEVEVIEKNSQYAAFFGGRLMPYEAGQYITIGIDANQTSSVLEARQMAEVVAASTAYRNGAPFDTDGQVSALLSLAFSRYVEKFDAVRDGVADLAHMWRIEFPSYAFVSGEMYGETHWELNLPFAPKSALITVESSSAYGYVDPIAGADPGNARYEAEGTFVGWTGSALEHDIWEEMINTEAVSTVKALQLAAERGVPVFRIDSSNVSTYLPQLNLAPGIEANIAAGVAKGAKVIVPRDELVIGDLKGVGYYLEGGDYQGYDGGYMISFSKTARGGESADRQQAVVPLQSGSTTGQSTAGDPVNIANGNYVHDEMDVSLPGAGLALRFARHYDSQATHDVGLGRGWVYAYADRLTVAGDGTVTWLTDQGYRLAFKPRATGGYANPERYFGTFSRDAAGYTYRETDGMRHSFDLSGRLVRIEDRNGNRIDLTYDANGRLANVIDADAPARRLVFSWSGDRLSAVSDFGGRTWSFGFSGALLSSVTRPSDANTPASVLRYGYYTDAARKDWIASITAPDGGETRFDYYTNGRVFRVTDALGAQQTFYYSLHHQQSEFVNERGYAVTYSYDPSGRMVKLVNADRTSESFTWVNGLLTRETDVFGASRSYDYDAIGNIVRQVDKAGIETRYTYEPLFNQIASQLRVADGQRTLYHYDARGNLIRVDDALGNYTLMTYDSRGLMLSRTTPKGSATATVGDYTTTYTYNSAGQVLTETNDLPATITRSYDALGREIVRTDANGNATTFGYDLLDRVIRITDPLDRITQRRYSAAGNLVSVTDALGQTSQFAYDLKQRLSESIAADGTLSRSIYDAVGNLIARTDALGRASEQRHDERDRRVETVFADGARQTVRYDGGGHVVASADASGNTTTYAYDRAGRLVKTTDALGFSSTMTYDHVGRLDASIDRRGALTRSSHDLLDRRVRVDGEEGLRSRTTYDADGHVIAQTRYDIQGLSSVPSNLDTLAESRKRTDRIVYDVAGRAIERIDPLGNVTRFEYDAGGRVLREFDARGVVTAYAYDAAGNLLERTAGDGGATRYAYDALNRVTGITLPLGGHWRTGYDKVGHVVSETDPLGRVTTYAFDAVGNLLRQTNADDSAITNAYDMRDRLIRRDTGPGQYSTYAYDANGNLLLSQTEASTLQFSYDKLHRRTSELLSLDDNYRSQTDYAYDAEGNLIRQTEGQRAQSYTYDLAGRLLSAAGSEGESATLTYDGFGRRATTTYGSGARDSFGYDLEGNLVSINYTHGNTGSSIGYQRDAAGAPIRVTENLNGSAETLTVALDALGRPVQVAAANNAARNETFVYDLNGNLIDPGRDRDQVFDVADQLTRDAAGTVYSHDVQGNRSVLQSADGSRQKTEHDAAGRTVALRTYDAQGSLIRTVLFSYDGLGRRVRAVEGNATTYQRFAFDRLMEIRVDVAGTENDTSIRYLSGIALDDVFAARVQVGSFGATSLQYVHRDAIGSVRMVTSSFQVVVATASYAMFGQTQSTTGSSTISLGYVARPSIAGTALIDLRARLYDASAGQFLGHDPVSTLSRGLSLYAYADNVPLVLVDPTGKTPTFGNSRGWGNHYTQGIGAVDSMLGFGSIDMPLYEFDHISLGGAMDYGPVLSTDGWSSIKDLGTGALGAFASAAATDLAGSMLLRGFLSGLGESLTYGAAYSWEAAASAGALSGATSAGWAAATTFAVGTLAVTGAAMTGVGIGSAINVWADQNPTVRGAINYVFDSSAAHSVYGGVMRANDSAESIRRQSEQFILNHWNTVFGK